MLAGKLSLYGINDVEAFAVAIVNGSRLELDYHDREDLIVYLVETCWELSLRYDRGDPTYPPRFSVYATPILRKRVVDWQRKRFGRTRYVFRDRILERPRVELVSLDDPGGAPVGDALGTRTGDPAADRDPDLERLLGTRDSLRARDYETLGLRPPRRATG